MKKIILINAIVWATVILVASYLFKDFPNYPYFFAGLVFAAGLMNSILVGQAKGREKSCR